MEYWLKVLREEEKKIKQLEANLKKENNPHRDSQISDLDESDKGLKSILESKSHVYSVGEILKHQSAFNAMAEASSNYMRGLFRLKNRVNGSYINAIMHLLGHKYAAIDLVAHYDGKIFDPKDEKSWHEIMGIKEEGNIAIYSRNLRNFYDSKAVIDVMGSLMGDYVEIPVLQDRFANGFSQVERLAASEYRLEIALKEQMVLGDDCINAIMDCANVPYENHLNQGSVILLCGNKMYDAKNPLNMYGLKGKHVQKLNFVFRGGSSKDAAYALSEYLSK